MRASQGEQGPAGSDAHPSRAGPWCPVPPVPREAPEELASETAASAAALGWPACWPAPYSSSQVPSPAPQTPHPHFSFSCAAPEQYPEDAGAPSSLPSPEVRTLQHWIDDADGALAVAARAGAEQVAEQEAEQCGCQFKAASWRCSSPDTLCQHGEKPRVAQDRLPCKLRVLRH